MDEQDQLNKAIAQLYQTFAPYPARRHMPACPHCVSQAEIDAITTVPLQSLTANSFGRYPSKAITTWGEATDYRYFLPRLLELMPDDPYDFYLGIERVCQNLAYAQWQTWPLPEQQAILDYFHAYWRWVLADYTERPALAMECVHALGYALADIMPFLAFWQNACTPPALRHLANFIVNQQYAAGKRNCSLLYWHGYAPIEKQIITWLLDPRTRQQLEDYYFRYEQETYAHEMAEAADMLFSLQATYATP